MAIAGQIEYKVTVDSSGLKKGLADAKKEASSFSSNLASIGRAGKSRDSSAQLRQAQLRQQAR